MKLNYIKVFVLKDNLAQYKDKDLVLMQLQLDFFFFPISHPSHLSLKRSLLSTVKKFQLIIPVSFIQIAFHPKFLSSRVEKERRAILSELQMMNTIEYRVDCQVLIRVILWFVLFIILSLLEF